MTGIHTFGIDVSSYSKKINWKKVAAKNPHFVFARATYITSDLKEGTDRMFSTYWSGLKSLDMRRGAYHFCRPGYDPDKSVELFFSVYTPNKGDIVPTLDIEDEYDSDSGPAKKKVAQIRRMVELISSRLGGRKPMIYTKKRVWDELGNPQEFGDCPLWILDYDKTHVNPALPSGWQSYAFWQTAADLTMDGIEGDYDPDFFNGPPGDMKKYCLK